MQEINIKLDVFEGPLDLLLHLIQHLELDIYDIPIATITEQYLHYIDTMQTLELEVAGEYLVMAATLMAIKSQMLLPKPELPEIEELEEGEDPRDALVEQLLEYRKYKYVAQTLHAKEEDRSLFYTKEPMNLSPYQSEVPKLDPNRFNTIDLFLAFHQMLEKRKQQGPLETTVAGEDVSIDDKIHLIQSQLRLNRSGLQFEDFFNAATKSEVVTTFMAMLEMMKKGTIRVKQSAPFEPIMLFATEEEEQ